MHIEAVTLRKLKMRLWAPFETSFGITRERTVILVELLADGITGWAEVTTSEGPFFNSETPETAWLVIRRFLAPLVLGKDLRCASEVARIFAAIRGHEMARGNRERALGRRSSTKERAARKITRRHAFRDQVRRFPGAAALS
jgi:O-succinylbenzoate synthase